MIGNFLALFLASVALHAPPLARADCQNLRFQNFSASTVNFTNNASPSVTFDARRNGSGGCTFYIACSNNDGAEAGAYTSRSIERGGAYIIPVMICLDASCTLHFKRRGEANSSEVLTGTFPDGNSSPSTISYTFYPRLGTHDYPRFGTYERQFTLRMHEAAFNTSNQVDTKNITLRYTVSKAIALSLVDTGATFNDTSTSKTLDFGLFSFTSASQRSADLVLKYNAGYRIRMSSVNANKLRRVGGTQTINYALTVDGAAVSLGTGLSQIATGSGTSPAGGKRLPIVATVDAVPAAQAPGTYSDSIMIQVQTTE